MKAPELSNIVLRKDMPTSLLIRLLFGVASDSEWGGGGGVSTRVSFLAQNLSGKEICYTTKLNFVGIFARKSNFSGLFIG